MSTLKIRDLHEPESDFFIEDLGKIHGGAAKTTLTIGKVVLRDWPKTPWFKTPWFKKPCYGVEHGCGGSVTTYALGEEGV